MSPNDVAVVAAIFAGISALAGVAAAIASWRSSNTAVRTVNSQQESQRSNRHISLGALSQRVLGESKAVKRLCEELKGNYNDLFSFSGNLGSSRKQLYQDRIDQYLVQVAKIVEKVQTETPEQTKIQTLSDEQLSHIEITFAVVHEEIHALHKMVAEERAEAMQMIRMYQQKIISS